MIKVSVPGKVHLLGEHSVVYGKPALFSSISLKVHITVIASASKAISIVDSESNMSGMTESDNKKLQKLKQVLEKTIQKRFNIKKIPHYQIQINSELPIGSGLGSSAAISVGWTKALLKLLKIPEDKADVFEIALEGEKIFHGNPSGGDIAAVLNEGLTWYRKESDEVKIIQPLSFPISKKLQNFFLIDSGKPVESTSKMVELVNHRVILRGAKDIKIKYQKIFDHQEILVKQLTSALKNGDEKLLMECIQKGEINLEKLGVVGKKAKEIIKKIEVKGGVAKILGGGGVKMGSGMLLGYLSNKKSLLELTTANKWGIIPIKL